MRNSTERFKQIYFPPPVKNRFSLLTFIIGLINVAVAFVPSVPQKWKLSIFILYCTFLVVLYIRGMIDNNQLLLEKIDNLEKEKINLKSNRDGLIEQYHKDKKEISELKSQIHEQENFRLIVCTILPLEVVRELFERQRLLNLNNKESEKSDDKWK